MSGFGNRNAAWVEAFVAEEDGRFVVYLEVGFWETDEAEPFQSVRHRIQEYATRQKAEVAAKLFQRNAGRDLRNPPMGF